MDNIERELKTSLNKTEYETLLKVGNAEPQLQTNHYFYCDKMPADVMLRIRQKSGKYLFCYKKLLDSANGVNVCDEREKDLDEDYANTLLNSGITPAILKQLVGVELPYTCKRVGSLNTYRAKFTLKNWTIELDKNEYLGTVDYELECECDSDELLEELKDCLSRDYGIPFRSSLSKKARFFNKLFDDK